MKAEKKKQEVTEQQLEYIKSMYLKISNNFGQKIKELEGKTNISSILRTQYLHEYQKELADEISKINQKIGSNIKNGMEQVAQAVVDNEVDRALSYGLLGISGKFSNIPTDVVETIVSGQLYQSDWTLSKAIWGMNEKVHKDCQNIVAMGIASNKGVYDVAKALEQYVDPSAKKDYKWSRDYPGSNKVVDYNASRLARTMMSHAYQESFERATEHDPFIQGYKWNTGHNTRVCPYCMAMSTEDKFGLGQGIYPKDKVPLDHPNGQCFLTIVQNKSSKQVADDIANWYNGTGDAEMNAKIDKFAESLGYKPTTNKILNAKSAVSKATKNNIEFVNANDYIKSELPSIKNKYEDTFGIDVPINKVVMNESDFEGLMSGAYAYVKNDDKNTLYVNPNIFKSKDDFINTIGGRIRAYHDNADVDSILAHELSHAVALDIGEEQYKAVDYAVSNFMNTYKKTAMDIGLEDYQIAGEYISRYATTTKEEFFAEAFADFYKNGEKANQLSKDVVKYVKEHAKTNAKTNAKIKNNIIQDNKVIDGKDISKSWGKKKRRI